MIDLINKNNDTDLGNLYNFIQCYADSNDMANTLLAIRLMDDMTAQFPETENIFKYSLMICRMLIDLNMDLSANEIDTLIAASLLHMIPEDRSQSEAYKQLFRKYHIPDNICRIIDLLSERNTDADEELSACFARIQENKLALLIALAEQGNIVERLHFLNSWQFRKFIYDTRKYYFSMCIYAKEHYIELLSPIGILLEKLRNLTDVAEMLFAKFESMEIELTREILQLKEENATIKGIIQKLKTSC